MTYIMKALATEPPAGEITVFKIATIGGLLIINVAPFLKAEELGYEFYLFLSPVLLIFSIILGSWVFMFKSVSYDEDKITIASRDKKKVVPLADVSVFITLTQCYLMYSRDGTRKLTVFNLNVPFSFGITRSDKILIDFKNAVKKAKKSRTDHAK